MPSCFTKKANIITYTTLVPPNGTITLLSDSTFNADYKMAGYSFGNWIKHGDTLILNSKYRNCCINSIKSSVSKTDTSDQSIVFLKLINGRSPSYAYLILENSKINDTLLFVDPITLNYTIEKKSNHNLFKVVQPNFYGGVKGNAISNKFNIELKDTITIYYDYIYDVMNYRFYNDEKFIIDSKNRIISPARVGL